MKTQFCNSKSFKLQTRQHSVERFKSSLELKQLIMANDLSISEFKSMKSPKRSETVNDSVTIKNYINYSHPINYSCTRPLVNTMELNRKIKESLEKNAMPKIVNPKHRLSKTESLYSQVETPFPYIYTPLKMIDCNHLSYNKLYLQKSLQNSNRFFESLNGILHLKPQNARVVIPEFAKPNFTKSPEEFLMDIPLNEISETILTKMPELTQKDFPIVKLGTEIGETFRSSSSVHQSEMKFKHSSSSTKNTAFLIEKPFSDVSTGMLTNESELSPNRFTDHSLLEERIFKNISTLFSKSIENLPQKPLLHLNNILPRNNFVEHETDNTLSPDIRIKNDFKFKRENLHKKHAPTFYEKVTFSSDSDDLDILENESKDVELALNYTERLIVNSKRILERSSTGQERHATKSVNSKVVEYYGNFGFIDGVNLERQYNLGTEIDFDSETENLQARESFKALSHMYGLKTLVGRSSMFTRDDEDDISIVAIETVLKDLILTINDMSSKSSSVQLSDESLGAVDINLVNAFTKRRNTSSSSKESRSSKTKM